MNRKLDKKISVVKEWLVTYMIQLSQKSLTVKVRSDTPNWYAVDIFDDIIVLSVEVNSLVGAPYYSVAIEYYDFSKEESDVFVDYWYDSEDSQIEDIKQALSNFIELVI